MGDKKDGNQVEREHEVEYRSISTKHHTETITEAVSTAHHSNVMRDSSGETTRSNNESESPDQSAPKIGTQEGDRALRGSSETKQGKDL